MSVVSGFDIVDHKLIVQFLETKVVLSINPLLRGDDIIGVQEIKLAYNGKFQARYVPVGSLQLIEGSLADLEEHLQNAWCDYLRWLNPIDWKTYFAALVAEFAFEEFSSGHLVLV